MSYRERIEALSAGLDPEGYGVTRAAAIAIATEADATEAQLRAENAMLREDAERWAKEANNRDDLVCEVAQLRAALKRVSESAQAVTTGGTRQDRLLPGAIALDGCACPRARRNRCPRPADQGAQQVSIQLIHISTGGLDRWLSVAGKLIRFEDHPHCGPIVLTNMTGEVSEAQPPERHPFWSHVTAWYQQGKQTFQVDDKVWCKYQTDLMAARKKEPSK